MNNIIKVIRDFISPKKRYLLLLDGAAPIIPYSEIERLCKEILPENKEGYERCLGESTIFGPLVGSVGYDKDGGYKIFVKHHIEFTHNTITLHMRSKTK